ncbi:NAD(P)-dependent oxidoreductase [Deinococcus sp. NW-56]|uniref:NAD(P)-dependent oxidoreductase n=1 Tax=Deinococcus sp. NW-56 TaxID=2080419 RepID=UPI000CF40F99|nr:NAD(P)H-binding protein [Deinococcus sp. NW-56]
MTAGLSETLGAGTTLALLGGTGRTGRLLIDQALTQGHALRVLARDPERLHRRAEALLPVPGDARNADDVFRLLEGADAVLSALGPVRGDGAGVMAQAAGHLVAVMPGLGLSRLITLTGAGVRQPGDRPKLSDRLIRRALATLQPGVLRDAEAHVATITASPLDWTVVRAPRLGDGPIRPLKVGLVGDIGPFVSRASVADFMLRELREGRWVRQAPAVSH